MYLLDTNVVSALRRPERNRAVSQWLSGQSPDDLYISVITVGEIEYGIARQRRTQPEFASRLEDWMESVRTSFSSRVLLFDEASARRWGRLHAELGYTNSDPSHCSYRPGARPCGSDSQRQALRADGRKGTQPVWRHGRKWLSWCAQFIRGRF